jgi:hypothetical protein
VGIVKDVEEYSKDLKKKKREKKKKKKKRKKWKEKVGKRVGLLGEWRVKGFRV